MKLQYDKTEDALYITMAKGKFNKSRKISDSILVDETKDGKVIGIEVLNASHNIQHFDPKNKSSQKIQITTK